MVKVGRFSSRPAAMLLALLLAGCATFQEGATDVPIPGEATFVEVEGWRILVRQEGRSGPPVLLVHGYSAMHLEWLPVV